MVRGSSTGPGLGGGGALRPRTASRIRSITAPARYRPRPGRRQVARARRSRLAVSGWPSSGKAGRRVGSFACVALRLIFDIAHVDARADPWLSIRTRRRRIGRLHARRRARLLNITHRLLPLLEMPSAGPGDCAPVLSRTAGRPICCDDAREDARDDPGTASPLRPSVRAALTCKVAYLCSARPDRVVARIIRT